MAVPGDMNLITDVPGLMVGQAQCNRAVTGVTVVTGGSLFTAACDVRGGGPGSRETDVLGPSNLVQKINAVVLSGGSVYGLAAGDGVVSALAQNGIGQVFGKTPVPIPIVPGAVLHDLGNGGDKTWGMTPPYRDLGIEALDQAGRAFELGLFGAGRGAMAGLVKGGIGSASLDLGDGLVVGALVAVNAAGSVVTPGGQHFYAAPYEIGMEFGGFGLGPKEDLSEPLPAYSRLRYREELALSAAANTTLAVVASNGGLNRAECMRVATMAHDGMARAIRPVHTPFDGDIVFALSTDDPGGMPPREYESDRTFKLTKMGAAAGDCLARAIARAVYHANPDLFSTT